MHTRRSKLRQLVARVLLRHRAARANLGVGRVSAIAIHQLALARFRQNHELLGATTANLAAVCLHNAVIEAHTAEHVAVRIAHLRIAGIQALLIGVKAVRILHNELAATQQTETRTTLIAEFQLNLIQVLRQVLIAAKLVFHQVSDYFFMRRTQAILHIMTVGKAKHLRAVRIPTPAFAPQLGVLHKRHKKLLAAVRVHFFAHDVLNLAQNARAQRHERIHARCFFAQHARARQQLRAGNVSVTRIFLERGRVHLAHFQNSAHSFAISSISASKISSSLTLRNISP